MTLLNIFTMFPLQTVSYFGRDQKESSNETIILIVILVAVAVVFIILNALKKKPSGTGSSGGGVAISGLFSGLALHRIAKSIGLNHEQTKMLDFVFKTDEVTDAEKSINTPSLLDRHFRRAYRVIEQSANSEDEAQHRLSVLFSTRNMLENNVTGGLTSTRQLKDDATVIIANGNEKYNVAVISNKNEHLAVECPKNALGSLIKMPKGNKLNALLFTKNNKGFSFETRITGYSNSHVPAALLLAHSNQLKYLSKRRFRRRQAVIDCHINLVYVEGSGKKQRLIVDKHRLAGSIADISVGGCSIKTKSQIPVGAKLKVEFNQGGSNVAALGQVLRTNRTSGATVIHAKFLKVSRKSMNLINAFVYEYAHE